MQLGERLKAAADFALPCRVAADIGTDHAYLAVALAERGAVRVIAADLNAGPCESARRTVRENDCEEKVEVRQGDGLAVLKAGEADTVCIAGMGGELITVILAARPEITQSIKRLVLQPMNDTRLVREWLYAHGWHVADESLAREGGRLYEIICAEQGNGERPEGIMQEIGPKLWEKRDLLLGEHIAGLLRKKKKVLGGMGKSEAARRSERYRQVLREKEELEARLGCLNVR